MSTPSSEVDAQAAARVQELNDQTWSNLLHVMSLRFVLSPAEDQPVVAKQIYQLILLLLYPVWLVCMVVVLAVWGVLWVLLIPMRARQRRRKDIAAQPVSPT